MMKESIFVSIISCRDPLLVETVRSVFEESSGMFDINIGIFEQIVKEDSLPIKHTDIWEKYKNQIRYKRIDPEYADGVGWARAINALQIQEEDYYYQIDSHMAFDTNWDRDLVKEYKRGKEKFGTDRIIITAGCKMYELDDNGKPKLERHNVTSRFRYFCFQPNWMLGPHGDYIEVQKDLTPAIHCSAGNFFTHTEWHRNVGINGRVYFEGEEQIMTLESYNAGYYLCHPTEIHAYHYRNTHNYISKPWNQPVIDMNSYNVGLKRTFAELHYVINSLSDETLERYREYSGVDYKNRKLERRAITNTVVVPESIVDTWTIEDRV